MKPANSRLVQKQVILVNSVHPQYTAHCTFMTSTVRYSMVFSEVKTLSNRLPFEQHEFFRSDANQGVYGIYEETLGPGTITECLEKAGWIVIDKRLGFTGYCQSAAMKQMAQGARYHPDPDPTSVPDPATTPQNNVSQIIKGIAAHVGKLEVAAFYPKVERVIGVDPAATPEQKMNARRDELLRNIFG